MKLNEGQVNAINNAIDWYTKNNKQIFEVTGPAGTGKSTIIYEMVRKLGLDINKEVLFMAFVGQASLVLRRKNLYAKTIHSSIYDVIEIPLLDDKGVPVIDKYGNIVNRISFKRKVVIDPDVKLLVVDEASMVPQTLKDDILSFGLPVIA